MSLLFTAFFDKHPISVLEIRGRVAFLPHEIGVAAGYSGDGQRFVDQIVREWPASLEEDDDIAQLVGRELDVLKREVPLPPSTTTAIVLFPTGVERCLLRSHVRSARDLIDFIHEDVLSRVVAYNHANTPARGWSNDGGGSPAPALPPLPPSTSLQKAISGERPRPSGALAEAVAKMKALGKRLDRVEERKHAYRETIQLAEVLRGAGAVTTEQWAALRVEALELLLGHALRTPLALVQDMAPFASAAN